MFVIEEASLLKILLRERPKASLYSVLCYNLQEIRIIAQSLVYHSKILRQPIKNHHHILFKRNC